MVAKAELCGTHFSKGAGLEIALKCRLGEAGVPAGLGASCREQKQLLLLEGI